MNKQQFKALLAVNLRLVNPQVTDRYRRKGKSGRELTKKLQLQFWLNLFIFLMIYGFTMFSFDFSKMPGMFTFYTGLFVLLAFSQSISGIYNIFFAGKDLNSYLPLPFRQNEIFLSKILIIVSNVIPYTMPLPVVFFVTAWRAGLFIPLAILLALFVYLIILTIVLLICSLIVFGLTKTKLFQQHQSIVMNVLLAVTMVIAVGGILMMNGQDDYDATGGLQDRKPLTVFLPLFQIFKNIFSVSSGEAWLELIALLLIFGGIMKYFILPHLTEQLTIVNSTAADSFKKHKYIRRSNLQQILDSYNRQLLKEPNLLLQILSNSIVIPIIFIFSFGFAGVPNNLPAKWLGVFFVAGIAFSGMTINQSSLIGNLISLDRTNFEFIKSLPISMSKYLHRKFLLGFVFQMIINVLILVVATVVLKLSLAMLLALILGSALGTYLISQHYFSRDYKLRLTNWTNVTQLFSRGGGNLGMAASIFISIIVGVAVIVVYSILISIEQIALMVNGIVAISLIVISILLIKYYQKNFWKQFE